MRTGNLMTAAALAIAAGFLSPIAQATPLTPGDTIIVTGSTSASNPELAGVILQDSILTTNSMQVPPEANPLVNFADFDVQNRVVQSGMDGTMIFMPRILFSRNVTPYPLQVNRVEMFGFGDYAIDATYRTDGLGDSGPTFGARSADGQILSFDFGFPLVISNLFAGLQEESYFFSLKSDATEFENSGRLSIFAQAVGDPVQGREYRFDVGGIAVPTDTPPVPLPASLPFLAIAIGALTAFRRRDSE